MSVCVIIEIMKGRVWFAHRKANRKGPIKMTNEITLVDNNTDAVYSPDDGGWYLQTYLRDGSDKTRVSKKIYDSSVSAITAYLRGAVIWV